ncbi:Vacuolar fusion protein mon1 [Vanrija albida]|uniref:Vacuolar fusion protein MON1 n=1 Tax=Vanrija albida TaxID=181172 RepID=A0ABR3Q3H3_9TREE
MTPSEAPHGDTAATTAASASASASASTSPAAASLSPPAPAPPALTPSSPGTPPPRARSPFQATPRPALPSTSVSSLSVSTYLDAGSPSRTPSARGRHRRSGTGSRSLLGSTGSAPGLLAPPVASTASTAMALLELDRATSPGADSPASPGELGASGRTSPASGSSRKGKERAVDDEMDEAEAVGQVVPVPSDVRRGLRELVARSDDRRSSRGGRERAVSRAAADHVHTLPVPPDRGYAPRRYYVLTNAGKPVLALNHGNDSDLSEMMGIAQALISILAEDDDRLRSISRGRTRITFTLKAPLYLFAVSDWGEPEHVMRMHLEYINLQILSVVTQSQLQRAFQRRSNFDLSRLLEGSEPFLNKLVEQCQDDLSFFTTTLQPLRMPPGLRDTAAAALMPPAKFKDLLYVLLIAGGRIVTLLRPRRHAVHPSDMHLLLNTLATSATLRTVETWLPLCLPKFNPAGFVHAYISFVRDDVGLVFISADRDAFESLCQWRVSVVDHLKKDNALDRIEQCIKQHPYTVSVVGSPGLRHFVYKSRGLIQLTSPDWEEPYLPGSVDRKRLVTLYARVQDALYARSGQSAPLKLVYMATAHEAVLGWLTKPFELYVTVSPHLPMSAVVSTANKVAKWVNAEESRLFLKDAPVF